MDPGLLPILERLSEGVAHLSTGGRILAANPRAAHLLGFDDPEALVGRLWTELVPDGTDLRHRPLPTSPTGAVEWRVEREREGALVVRGSVQRLPDGTFLASLQDVTELRELERQFSEAQKMESLGRLACGICHDFRNLLTVIRANASLLLGDTDADHPFRAQLQEMHLAAQRGGELVAQIMAHTRPGKGEPCPTDLRRVVREIRPLVNRVVGDDVEVLLEEPGTPVGVVADPHRLEQVILNLVANARDAMRRGGRLTLRTGTREVASGNGNGAGPRPGRYACLSVRDTGHGMSPEILDRIFQPFFTTKSPGEGTGLGLSSVVRIVQGFGGHVTVESEPDRGTAFHVHLPLVALDGPAPSDAPDGAEAASEASPGDPSPADDGAARPAERASAPPAPEESGSATVLVVEDEPAIRSVLRQILERGGVRVLTAASGEEAVRMAQDFQGRLDSLLTDLNLPGMDGTEIGRAVRDLHPGVQVTIMSGYGPDAVESDLMEGLQAGFLQKPFAPETLVNLVRSIASHDGEGPTGRAPSHPDGP